MNGEPQPVIHLKVPSSGEYGQDSLSADVEEMDEKSSIHSSSDDEFSRDIWHETGVDTPVDKLVNVEIKPEEEVELAPSPTSTLVGSEITIAEELKSEEVSLRLTIEQLRATYHQLQGQVLVTQTNMGQFIQESLRELEERKQVLKVAVEQLERRQERIRAEMRTNFAGASQDLAIRVQGFKDYLVGSLQDLAAAADQLELSPKVVPVSPSAVPVVKEPEVPQSPKFAEQAFQAQTKQVRRLLDHYRSQPDYYGPPWKLRRTFEPIHGERVSNWFFTQGGRGALKSMGTRLQNVLIASAVISVLRELYGDRLRVLILANAPERLGEWRRGLQDCLGVSRADFGPDRGLLLFETPENLAQKADRLVKERLLPFILIDETEEMISLAILQFPLWLAFVSDSQHPNYGDSRSTSSW